MHYTKEEILHEGNPILVNTLRINDQAVVAYGKYLNIARIKDEWFENVDDPETIIRTLKSVRPKPDIFTFWQRLPEAEPKFSYFMEWETLAAIPITTYEHWWNKQINVKTRNMVRKGGKKGVEIKIAEFNDELVRGIMNVFNETPVKRGKQHRHYGKSFDTVKREMSDVLDKSLFIGAYYENSLIGFIKMSISDRYAMITVILCMMQHRDKGPINALVAKAVEICAERGIPYLTYTTWRKGSVGEFQKHNAFEKYPVPRYFVPITLKGKLALNLKLHHGIKGMLPDEIRLLLLRLRGFWYEKIWAKKQHLFGLE